MGYVVWDGGTLCYSAFQKHRQLTRGVSINGYHFPLQLPFPTVWMCEAYVIIWVWIWWVLLWCGCFGNGKQHSLTTLTEVFPCFSSVVRQMPGLNSQSRGTDRISSELLSFVLCLSLCCAIVFMLFCCYYVVLLLCYAIVFMLFCCYHVALLLCCSVIICVVLYIDCVYCTTATGC